MATKKKMLQAAAGSAVGGAGLDIDEVFSTYLYEGTGSARTITNGIDLSGEGGMLWIKSRTESEYNWVTDSERTLSDALATNDTTPLLEYTNRVTGYTSSGFTLGTRGEVNANSQDFASWTFRKAPKFFDVVTYSGNGSGSGQVINHNLATTVGCIIIKRTDTAEDWAVYHRGMDATVPEQYFMYLNGTGARIDSDQNWLDTVPTDTNFTVGYNGRVNASGGTYVAYVFAHNDGDGEFGPDGDQDIIKCGSFTDSGSSSSPTDVNLGFEPQWLLVKASSTSSDWYLIDVMREMSVNDARHLRPNLSNAETNFSVGYFKPTPTGFQFRGDFFGAGEEAIYIAIRRGPLAPPEDATEVFAVNATRGATNGTASSNAFTSGWPIDLLLHGARNDNDNFTVDRLRGNKYLSTNRTDAEGGWIAGLDDMDGLYLTNTTSATSESCAWMWKRAPGFFDVVAYTGDSYSNRDVTHNLTVKPELVITKKRSSSGNWEVAAKITNTNYHGGLLNSSGSLVNTSLNVSGNAYSQFSDNHFQVGGTLNSSGDTYISYLFASLPGISKVGSYTGDGTTDGSKVIDCGFTSGARFVLIKNTTGGNWYVYDTARGIVSGNDPALELNSTSAEDNQYDSIDPYSAGFTLTAYGASSPSLNTPSETYIFYAIA